jgi:hypothetical protein
VVGYAPFTGTPATYSLPVNSDPEGVNRVPSNGEGGVASSSVLTASPVIGGHMPEGQRVEYVTPNEMFWRVLAAHRKEPEDQLREQYSRFNILGLDPGETTGVAFWDAQKGTIELQQLETKQIGQSYDMLENLVAYITIDHIRCEEYRIYNWMADSHAWSILHTPQLIGAIKVLAHREGYDLSFKLAQHAKATWNDNVLRQCGLYSPGLKHARDACRHLLYYMTKPSESD